VGTAPIILGDPGSGKSSLLRHLAERAWTAPETVGLGMPHIPLLVPLPQMAAFSGPLEKRIAMVLEEELSLASALPVGFFDRWPKEMGARWILLLDALDEVPSKSRTKFLQWLSGALAHVGPHRFVLTSRASSYRDGDISASSLKQYEILPFAPEQTDEFARKWFGEDSSSFLKSFQRTNVGDLQHTPLLLAIAAKVYIEHRNLPERRARLYGAFVSIMIEEARQKGIGAETGERLDKVSAFALSHIARHMVVHYGLSDEREIIGALGKYLEQALGMSQDESLIDAARFIDVMARRSGLLIRRGRALGFIHPTIQEYFASTAIVHECRERPDALWKDYLSHWRTRQWREVSLFVLGILSEQAKEVAPLFRAILPELPAAELRFMIDAMNEGEEPDLFEPDGALMFATEAIRDGIDLPASEYNRVAGYHLAVIQRLDESTLREIAEAPSSPFSALRMLRASPAAERGLRAITRNTTMSGYLRYVAMDVLLALRKADAILIKPPS
jgi:predicted NACHT family NTPase